MPPPLPSLQLRRLLLRGFVSSSSATPLQSQSRIIFPTPSFSHPPPPRFSVFPCRLFSSESNAESETLDSSQIAISFSKELTGNPEAEPQSISQRFHLSFSHITPDRDLILQTLSLSPEAGRAALGFNEWLDSNAGFSHDDDTVSLFVDYFGRRKDFKGMQEIITKYKGIAGAKTLESAIDRLVRAGRPKQVVEFFEKMENDYGLKRDRESLTLVVKKLCEKGHGSFAEKLVKNTANEIFPDEKICDLLISGWCAAEQFEALGSDISLRCAVLVGGIDRMQQTIALGKRPHVIVATPGRLWDHMSDTKGFSLKTLKYLVLDEADRLLNEDFEKSLNQILEEIPRDRKTYLFSATMTKKVRKLQRACLRNPVKIEAASKYSTVDTLKQQYRFVAAKYKDCYLVYILSEMPDSTSMIFTRTCEGTRFMALMLRSLGFRAIPISGQMTQSKRLGALNKFKAGECNILVCTDVASRGLDIPSVDMVINYDIPTNSKDYIHRVGRTARAGRSGVGISLVNQYELEWYLQIEKLIGKKLPQYPAEEDEVLSLLERVAEAKKLSAMNMKESGGRKQRRGEDDEESERFLGGNKGGNKDKKSSKKFKR